MLLQRRMLPAKSENATALRKTMLLVRVARMAGGK
jgi:hypothetical protein